MLMVQCLIDIHWMWSTHEYKFNEKFTLLICFKKKGNVPQIHWGTKQTNIIVLALLKGESNMLLTSGSQP